MRLSESTKVALTACAGVLIALALLTLLNGCAKKPAEVPATVLTTTGTNTKYEIPVNQVKEKELPDTAGKDKKRLIGSVTVPPSDKETHIDLYEEEEGLLEQAKEAVKGDKGSPGISAVSDNPGVKVKTEKHTGLWPYLAGIAGVIIGLIAARKWLQRFGWVVKIMSWAKNLIGL